MIAFPRIFVIWGTWFALIFLPFYEACLFDNAKWLIKIYVNATGGIQIYLVINIAKLIAKLLLVIKLIQF